MQYLQIKESGLKMTNKKREEKEIKNGIHFKNLKLDSTFWTSFILLLIMVLSIVGFALSGSGVDNGNDGQLPNEIPFQQFEDPSSGTIFWGTIRNSEQFIFLDINGYDNRTDLANIAGQIKLYQNLSVYIDSDYKSADSQYLISKALKGIKINEVKLNTLETCTEDTLVLTLNESFEGNCIKLISKEGEEFRDAENLVYFLVQ